MLIRSRGKVESSPDEFLVDASQSSTFSFSFADTVSSEAGQGPTSLRGAANTRSGSLVARIKILALRTHIGYNRTHYEYND